MTLKIDKAGRAIRPKPVRDRLGLHEGSDLDVTERCPTMIKKQGLWVHTGKLPPGFDAVQAIREDREERIRKHSI